MLQIVQFQCVGFCFTVFSSGIPISWICWLSWHLHTDFLYPPTSVHRSQFYDDVSIHY